MRSDLGIIAKAVYGRDVYMTKVRAPRLTMESFYGRKLDNRYHLIDVNVPSSFPIDREISTYFNIDKLSLSKRRYIELPEQNEKLVFNIDHISQDRDYLRIDGWAFIDGQSSRDQEHILLCNRITINLSLEVRLTTDLMSRITLIGLILMNPVS